MNTRERILTALSWEEPDRVPLTTYDWFLPRGHTERVLREAGDGLISRLPAHQVEHRQVEVITADGFTALVCVYFIYMLRKKCLLTIQSG
jgi:hypothetical protein